MPEIHAAIQVISEIQDVNANAIADPVSKLLRSGIEWKDGDIEFLRYANPSAYRMARQDAMESIDVAIAELYLELVAEGVTPPWAAVEIDVMLLKLAIGD